MIINDASSVTLQIFASLMIVIYNLNMVIVQVTGIYYSPKKFHITDPGGVKLLKENQNSFRFLK
jgi:hypothetical protein